jgi:ssDNA-binding Zn-finger/Zn-ribbon topoisomerase 1
MPEDNLCDTCKKQMSIQRSSKNSRFLVCRNADCKRGKRNAPSTPVAEEKRGKENKSAPRKSIFGFGF